MAIVVANGFEQIEMTDPRKRSRSDTFEVEVSIDAADPENYAAFCRAGVVEGRRVTSYPSIRTDLENAGAEWVDEEVVVDQGLVTSRKPDDPPAFDAKMIEEFAEGRHAGQREKSGTAAG